MAWHGPQCQRLEIFWADDVPSCKRCGSKASAPHNGGPLDDLPPPPPPPPTKRSQLRCVWPKSVNFQDLPAEHESAILGDIDSWETRGYKLEDSAAPAEAENDLQQAAKADTAQTTPKTGEVERQVQTLNRQGLYPKIEGPDGIRLLCIFGATSFSAPLHCDLIVARLNDPRCPIYEALSYTWADDNGDKSRSKRIYVGPEYHILPVTRSCNLALRRLRSSHERLVWVDAVCINQEDNAERNAQVALMRQIYSTASRIVVYLGEEANGSDIVMDTLASAEGKDTESVGLEMNNSIQALLTRPYFFRTWVIQEVTLAYKTTVSCGDRTITWAALERALQSGWMKARSDVPAWMGQAQKSNLDSELTDSRLIQLLENTMSCLAGDPRDKIFGILGLVGNGAADEGIVPVYSLSVQQVYTGVAAYLLVEPFLGRIIHYAMMGPKQVLNLPSWVPDWTSIHSPGKTGSEESKDVVIHIGSGVQSISPWYAASLGEPLEENELEIADRGFSAREAKMIEYGKKIWAANFDIGAIDRWDEGRNIRGYSRTGSLGVSSSLLFWVDQEGSLHSGEPRKLTTPALPGDILYQGGETPRLEREKEIRLIPELGGMFLVKRHRVGNTFSLMGKCSIKTLAAKKSMDVVEYCLRVIPHSLLRDLNPADKKWYTLQLRTMCAEIYRIVSWQKTMDFLAETRGQAGELAESGNVGHASSSISADAPPTKEAINNLPKLQQMWEEAVAKLGLGEEYVEESRDVGKKCPVTKFVEHICAGFFSAWWTLGDAWKTECSRGKDETLISCAEHLSALHERLIPSLTFERLVDYVYHYDDLLYNDLFLRAYVRSDHYGWKWKSWVLIKDVLPVLRRPFLDEPDLGSWELTRIRLWEQIATLHLIIDLQAISVATGMQLNTWAARTRLKEIIVV